MTELADYLQLHYGECKSLRNEGFCLCIKEHSSPAVQSVCPFFHKTNATTWEELAIWQKGIEHANDTKRGTL